jgi:hypothetical protein
MCLNDDAQITEIRTELQEIENKGYDNENVLLDISKIRDKYKK